MTLEELYKRFPVTNTGLQNEEAYRNCVGQEITVVAKLDNITTSDPSNEGFISIGQSFNTSMLTFLVC